MKKAVIFDLDGTLWDSTNCACEIWNQVFSHFDEVEFNMTQEKASSLMGKTMTEIGQVLFPELNEQKRTEIVDSFGDEEVKYLREHGANVFPEVEKTLAELQKEYELYIVSNCQDGYVQAFLHAHKMDKYFTDIEMSGRTGMDKGKNIVLLMDRNEITDAVYIGDTAGDEKASRYACIPFIWAKYGFGEAVKPDAVINSIAELPPKVKEFI